MLVINHLAFLGFAINWEKSSPLPSRQTVYLGLCLDSATMTVMLSPPRLQRWFARQRLDPRRHKLRVFPVWCRQTWNIGKDPPPFPWAGWRPT
ncbi:unnamed protein product [Boreogadus saida]